MSINQVYTTGDTVGYYLVDLPNGTLVVFNQVDLGQLFIIALLLLAFSLFCYDRIRRF
jgi:hypothetical protein